MDLNPDKIAHVMEAIFTRLKDYVLYFIKPSYFRDKLQYATTGGITFDFAIYIIIICLVAVGVYNQTGPEIIKIFVQAFSFALGIFGPMVFTTIVILKKYALINLPKLKNANAFLIYLRITFLYVLYTVLITFPIYWFPEAVYEWSGGIIWLFFCSLAKTFTFLWTLILINLILFKRWKIIILGTLLNFFLQIIISFLFFNVFFASITAREKVRDRSMVSVEREFYKLDPIIVNLKTIPEYTMYVEGVRNDTPLYVHNIDFQTLSNVEYRLFVPSKINADLGLAAIAQPLHNQYIDTLDQAIAYYENLKNTFQFKVNKNHVDTIIRFYNQIKSLVTNPFSDLRADSGVLISRYNRPLEVLAVEKLTRKFAGRATGMEYLVYVLPVSSFYLSRIERYFITENERQMNAHLPDRIVSGVMNFFENLIFGRWIKQESQT